MALQHIYKYTTESSVIVCLLAYFLLKCHYMAVYLKKISPEETCCQSS